MIRKYLIEEPLSASVPVAGVADLIQVLWLAQNWHRAHAQKECEAGARRIIIIFGQIAAFSRYYAVIFFAELHLLRDITRWTNECAVVRAPLATPYPRMESLVHRRKQNTA